MKKIDLKVSVIIPVYNTEKYLEECIDSVIAQTYKNLEIILVDDGSSDRSPLLCDQYAQTDTRVKVFHQKNGGLSIARNMGIKEASGEYIVFLDSDDYWDDAYIIEKLLKKIARKKSDVVNYRYKQYIEETGKYRNCLFSSEESFLGKTKEEVLEYLLQRGLYIASACNKMVRTEFIKTNQLYFTEHIVAEDVDWCARIMLLCSTIDYCNEDAYIYRQRQGSITHTIQYKNIKQICDNVKYCVALGNGLQKSEKMYGLYYSYVAYQYGVFLVANHYVKNEKVKNLVKKMKEYRWLLQFHMDKKTKSLYYINKYLGYRGLNIIMYLYSKAR